MLQPGHYVDLKSVKHTIYEFYFRLVKGEYKTCIIKKGELGLVELRTTNVDDVMFK